MVKIKVDGKEVEAAEGITVLAAAATLGIEIPTLCYMEGKPTGTSCMVCMVKITSEGRMAPSCGVRVVEGMEVESETEEVHHARKDALELLLSEHGGDCLGPCQPVCPAWMDIPRMIRQIAEGDHKGAIETVKADIALPAVLGRICPAPCEKGCRRAGHDSAVSICLLKRYVADADLASDSPYMPECRPDQKKSVAVVGAGPAGLAAAYYLRREGYGCTIFDDHEKPGGTLQYGIPEEELPRDVLQKEIALIEKLGVTFKLNKKVGDFHELKKDHQAVLLAAGKDSEFMKGDPKTFVTKEEGVFAVEGGKLAIHALARGKRAAFSIARYLSGKKVTGLKRPFTCRLGKLKPGEMEQFLEGAGHKERVDPADGLSDEEARIEASRCLRCDCAKLNGCKLKIHAEAYGAKPDRYKGERKTYERNTLHPDILFEPSKCISCGICITLTQEAGEDPGFSFMGRGFNVKVAVPFNRPLHEGVKQTASACAHACPTGALVLKER